MPLAHRRLLVCSTSVTRSATKATRLFLALGLLDEVHGHFGFAGARGGAEDDALVAGGEAFAEVVDGLDLVGA